jgi:hypothetical protein
MLKPILDLKPLIQKSASRDGDVVLAANFWLCLHQRGGYHTQYIKHS